MTLPPYLHQRNEIWIYSRISQGYFHSSFAASTGIVNLVTKNNMVYEDAVSYADSRSWDRELNDPHFSNLRKIWSFDEVLRFPERKQKIETMIGFTMGYYIHDKNTPHKLVEGPFMLESDANFYIDTFYGISRTYFTCQYYMQNPCNNIVKYLGEKEFTKRLMSFIHMKQLQKCMFRIQHGNYIGKFGIDMKQQLVQVKLQIPKHLQSDEKKCQSHHDLYLDLKSQLLLQHSQKNHYIFTQAICLFLKLFTNKIQLTLDVKSSAVESVADKLWRFYVYTPIHSNGKDLINFESALTNLIFHLVSDFNGKIDEDWSSELMLSIYNYNGAVDMKLLNFLVGSS